MTRSISTRDVALMAVFAALSIIVIKVFPGIPVIGVSGANIKFDAVLAPVYGMIIGPYLGFLAALFGGLLTAGSPFDILTSFAPATSALVAGLLTQKTITSSEGRVKGWTVALLVLTALVLGWYTTPIGQNAPFYPVLQIFGVSLIVAARGWTADRFREAKIDGNGWRVRPLFLLCGIVIAVLAYMFSMPYSSGVWILPYLFLPMFLVSAAILVLGLFDISKISFILAVSVSSYCAIIADHMVGNLVFIGSLNFLIPAMTDVPGLFMYVLPVSVVERSIFTAAATILGVGLVLAVRRANISGRKL